MPHLYFVNLYLHYSQIFICICCFLSKYSILQFVVVKVTLGNYNFFKHKFCSNFFFFFFFTSLVSFPLLVQ